MLTQAAALAAASNDPALDVAFVALSTLQPGQDLQQFQPIEAALAKLLPYQREDFHGIFKALKGYPATIRFLDPPLHEFLPHGKEQQMDLARKLGIDFEKIANRVHELHEFNPMLGFRGVRLAIAYPEIAEMQAQAIFEATLESARRGAPAILIGALALNMLMTFFDTR